MSYSIQQLSVGGILDHAFRLLRDHFLVLWGIPALVYVPLNVASEAVVGPMGEGQEPSGMALVVFVFVLVAAALAFPLVQLAIIHALAETYLGNPVTIGEAYSEMMRHYLRYLGTVILVGLGVLVGFALLVIPGIYLAVAWAVVGPVLVVEDIAGTGALSRSRELITGNWWRALGILFLATFIFSILSGGFEFVFSFIPFLGSALTGAINALAFAFSSTVTVLLYFDLRCRHEDFDLQILAGQIGGSGAPQPITP